MKAKMSFLGLVIAALFAMVALPGCGKSVDTANELAEALDKEGLEYTNIEQISTGKFRYARIDEAIRLKGNELNVEIFRIEDRRSYKAFTGAGLLIAMAEKKAGNRLVGRPSLYQKRPFIIIVRQEPRAGVVELALNAVLGGKEN